jgi:hypothetical protein
MVAVVASAVNYDKKYAYEIVRTGVLGVTQYADTLEEIARASEQEGVRVDHVEEGYFDRDPANGNRPVWHVRGKIRPGRWERFVKRPQTLGEARRQLEAVLERLVDAGFGIEGRDDGAIVIKQASKKRPAVVAPRRHISE